MNTLAAYKSLEQLDDKSYRYIINLLAEFKCLNLAELNWYHDVEVKPNMAINVVDRQSDLLPLLLQLDPEVPEHQLLASLVYKFNSYTRAAQFISAHYATLDKDSTYQDLIAEVREIANGATRYKFVAKTVYDVMVGNRFSTVSYIAPMQDLDYYHLLGKVKPSRAVELVKLTLQSGNLFNVSMLTKEIERSIDEYLAGRLTLIELEEIAVMLSSIHILRHHSPYQHVVDILMRFIVKSAKAY